MHLNTTDIMKKTSGAHLSDPFVSWKGKDVYPLIEFLSVSFW